MRIALVYDRVNKWGGAERVLLALHKLYPNAPLYTSVYNPKTAQWAKMFPRVYISFLQYFPFAKTRHDLFAFLMPLAFERFDFSEYDLVISVTSEAAKGIITKPETKHVCYLLTPTRYLWSGYEEYFNTPLRRFISLPIVNYLKNWDKMASSRPDKIISISECVKKRVQKYYKRDSEVVFPPVDIKKFNVNIPKFKYFSRGLIYGEYYLIVSRLVPYKKIDLAVKVLNKLKLPLIVVGIGSDQSRLISIAGDSIKFVGQVTEKELIYYYKGAKAIIFPQEEDFGLVAVEAQASGKPVISYKKGGGSEIIISDKTGILFDAQTEDSLEKAVMKLNSIKINENDCIENSKRFSLEKFFERFAKLVIN